MFSRSQYSYRSDPAVPAFDDSRPIALLDGHCALCCFGARLIDRFDRSGEIRICPVQTRLGAALMHHYGFSASSPETWLLLEQGRVLGEFEAVIRIGERSGGIGRALCLLRILPRGLRQWAYRWIASSRYRLFGRADLCALPSASLRARLLHDPP